MEIGCTGELECTDQSNKKTKKSVGQNDVFQQVNQQLISMVRNRQFDGFRTLLKKRVAARAITQLWLDNSEMRHLLLKEKVSLHLVDAQQPRLGSVPLLNLIELYFHEFDRLDELDTQSKSGLRYRFETVLKDQLRSFLTSKGNSQGSDLFASLLEQEDWVFSIQGPRKLVELANQQSMELEPAFEYCGLREFNAGRYADICRAHYFLEELQQIPVGQDDEVFFELRQPRVSEAPFEGEKRIGHAALEILIDRATGDPGEVWQTFILDVAGDPRIASTATNFRQWWRPLGEERIEKVRSWLSREDLRLFLRAVEQYGVESGDDSLQRMFPARKRFLEGLDKMGLVRRTRLMLGADAERAVRKILDSSIRTSFVRLSSSNGMSDKAVIYIDCGSFFIIQGSHNFKLWAYLAPPSESIYSYDTRELSHEDLTKITPRKYKDLYPELDYEAITHHSTTWQNKIISFLSENGVRLDLEEIMSRADYNSYVKRYGLPVVQVFSKYYFEVKK